MVVPDTNVLIAYFSSKKNPIVYLLDKMLEKQNVLFSVVAVAEFLVKAKPVESDFFLQIVDEIGIVPIDKEVMKQAILYRKSTLQKTKKSHLLDCFIAATAKIHKATLLTLDRHDYPFSDITVKQPEELMVSLKK